MVYFVLQEPSLTIPRIITEDYDSADTSMPATGRSHSLQTDSETGEPPQRQRMRSLSGPSHPISVSPHVRHSALISGGLGGNAHRPVNRRQSEDESLSSGYVRQRISPSTSSFMDSFRPRSTSDSKSGKKSVITTLKNNLLGASNNHNSNHKQSSCPVTPNHIDPFSLDRTPHNDIGQRPRSRSGSSGSVGAVSRMIDMFRGRSHSIAAGVETKHTRVGLLLNCYSVPEIAW